MQFTQAAEQVKRLQFLDTDTQLKLYGLYKQATVGDVNVPRPGVFNARARAKYHAWLEVKGMPATESERRYIELVSSLL